MKPDQARGMQAYQHRWCVCLCGPPHCALGAREEGEQALGRSPMVICVMMAKVKHSTYVVAPYTQPG